MDGCQLIIGSQVSLCVISINPYNDNNTDTNTFDTTPTTTISTTYNNDTTTTTDDNKQ